MFKPWKQLRNFVPAKHLKDYKDEYVQLIGWLVTTKPSSTSKNERMLFATFEDTETIYETTLFPRTYQKCAHLLFNRGPYLVQGTVDEDHGVFSCECGRTSKSEYKYKIIRGGCETRPCDV